MTHRPLPGLLLRAVAILAAAVGLCGAGLLPAASAEPPTASVVSIEIVPFDPSVVEGGTRHFVAIATFTDGTTQDVTALATWSSSDRSVARVANASGSSGIAEGIAPGSAVIGARWQSVTGLTTLTVTAAPTLVAIDIAPHEAVVGSGESVQLPAIGTYSDDPTQDLTDTAKWSSDDPATARVSATGLVTGVDGGATRISASAEGLTGSTGFSVIPTPTLVGIELIPVDPNIEAGDTPSFIAIGTYSDGTTKDLTTDATWSSDDHAVATISNAADSSGRTTGVGAGTALISARVGDRTGATVLTVT